MNDSETILAHRRAEIIKINEVPFLVTDKISEAVNYEHLLSSPMRFRGIEGVDDQQSFISHVDEFFNEKSKIWCDIDNQNFKAVYNGNTPEQPGHSDFRCIYNLKYSENWIAWVKADSKSFSQSEFAEFIDLNRHDIAHGEFNDKEIDNPTTSDLLEMVRNLQISSDTNFSRKIDRHGNIQQFSFQEENNVSQDLKIPAELTLVMPVFRSERLNLLTVKISVNFKKTDDKLGLSFRFQIREKQRIIDEEVKHIADTIGKACGQKIYFGHI